MSDDVPSGLATRYVFIDTQAYRQMRFDWSGPVFSKLIQHAKQDHVQILTTDITKGEVKVRLREMLSEAATAINKHSAILQNLGARIAVESMADETKALTTLEAGFERFLEETFAKTVPLVMDLNHLFADYFARRPPFSEKKKHEFPDAVVIASLTAWCTKQQEKIYVVSNDPDMPACCSPEGPLIHSPTITDIISRATVSLATSEALASAFKGSRYLFDELTDRIKRLEIHADDLSSAIGNDVESITGYVDDVNGLELIESNVVDRNGSRFTCELQYETDLSLDLEVQIAGYQVDEDDYMPPITHNPRVGITHNLVVYVDVDFDPTKPEKVEFESIQILEPRIELRRNQLGPSQLGLKY